MRLALYIDNIVARIDLQTEACGASKDTPSQLFVIYRKEKAELEALKEKCGPVVSIDKLA